ncbi:hypothetical protein QE152_g18159 [Popillia japonica]|uniref:Uncharacterized protein n=1 Tax=Popillia japonica TaxID=7064 RepID=A0AAW1L0A6_POPJA
MSGVAEDELTEEELTAVAGKPLLSSEVTRRGIEFAPEPEADASGSSEVTRRGIEFAPEPEADASGSSFKCCLVKNDSLLLLLKCFLIYLRRFHDPV